LSFSVLLDLESGPYTEPAILTLLIVDFRQILDNFTRPRRLFDDHVHTAEESFIAAFQDNFFNRPFYRIIANIGYRIYESRSHVKISSYGMSA
jgi:hypothetical protein